MIIEKIRSMLSRCNITGFKFSLVIPVILHTDNNSKVTFLVEKGLELNKYNIDLSKVDKLIMDGIEPKKVIEILKLLEMTYGDIQEKVVVIQEGTHLWDVFDEKRRKMVRVGYRHEHNFCNKLACYSTKKRDYSIYPIDYLYSQ